MKKYVKPELFYENYELSQYVASCVAKWNHAEGGCSVSVPGYENLFKSGLDICSDGAIGGIVCYQNTSDGQFAAFIS